MAWGSRSVLVLVALAVVLAACGEAPVQDLPEAPVPTVDRAPRAHVTPASDVEPEPEADADLWAAVDVLRNACEIADVEERRRACDEAEEVLRAAGDRAIPMLMAALREARDMPRDVVGVLGECGVAAVAPLCAALADRDHPARLEVALALGWGLAFRWSGTPEARHAAEALASVADEYRGGGDDVTDDEIAADEERAALALQALESLAFSRDSSAHLAPDIAAMWTRWHEFDAADDLQHQALLTLAEFGSDSAPVLPRILANYDRMDDPGELEDVFLLANRVGSAAPDALPILMDCLGDANPDVRRLAIGALWGWGAAATGFPERLATLIADPDQGVQRAAAFALATMPDGASLAWRELVRVDVLAPVLRDDVARALLVAGLPELPGDERTAAALELWDHGERGAARESLIVAARTMHQGALARLEAEPARLPEDLATLLEAEDRALADVLPALWDTPKELREQVAHGWDWPSGRRLAARLLAAREPIPSALAGDALVALTGAWSELVLPVLGDAPLPDHVADAIVRCAAATEGRQAESRRLGAAILLRRLPPERAVGCLLALARDPNQGVRSAALDTLTGVARAEPQIVPVESVRAVLGSFEPADGVFELIRALGARAAPLVPALTGIARDGEHGERERAAAALWRLGGDVEAAAEVMREFVAWVAASTDNQPSRCAGAYADAREVLLAAPLREGDLDRLLAGLGRTRLSMIVPLLARHGAAAAPAVPGLRRALQGSAEGFCVVDDGLQWGEPDPLTVEIARTLLAIGPAGRTALPELRQVIAFEGDRGGVLRDIVRQLEALR